MEATPTTPATPAGRSRAEILNDLADLDSKWRNSTNAAWPGWTDGVDLTYLRYEPDGTKRRVCVPGAGWKGVSAGRGPLPTQRCTTAKRAESTQIGQGGQ